MNTTRVILSPVKGCTACWEPRGCQCYWPIVSEQRHAPSDIGGASAYEDVSHRELLEVGQQARVGNTGEGIGLSDLPSRPDGAYLHRHRKVRPQRALLIALCLLM